VGWHNLLYNVQAKACPAWLGGIQGLEDLPELLGRYAAARILHIELYLGRRPLNVLRRSIGYARTRGREDGYFHVDLPFLLK